MKAVLAESHGEPDVLSVTTRPAPTPDTEEVTIAVEAAGVNFADVEKRRGDYPTKPDISTPEPSYIPGFEAAGRVVEAGKELAVSEGDRVLSFLSPACYCKYLTASADHLIPIPPELDYKTAAAIPIQWFTAHNTLHEWGGVTAGETVLIHAGAGGVGSAAIQLASQLDCTIYTTASTARKCEFARECGADRAVEYTDTSIQSVAEAELEDGFDLVLDGVGGSAFKESVQSLAPGGRIVSYGLASGNTPIVAAPRLLFQNRSVVGYHLEHAFANFPERVLTAKAPVLDGVADGELDVLIDRTFPLEEAEDAHRYLESRESTGKVLLDV